MHAYVRFKLRQKYGNELISENQLIEDEFISDFTLVWNFIRIKPELNSTGAGGVELAFALKCNLG